MIFSEAHDELRIMWEAHDTRLEQALVEALVQLAKILVMLSQKKEA